MASNQRSIVLVRSLLAVLVLLTALAGAGLAANPALDPLEQMLASGKPGREVVEALKKLPLEVRKTVEYHWLLARAYKAANDPTFTAEAIAVLTHLDPKTKYPVEPIKQWLAAESARLFKQAVECQQSGDSFGAADAFLRAVRCDACILERRDEGLGEKALATLARSLETTQKHPIYWYGLGFYNYRFSHLKAARRAFEEFLKRYNEPYWQWKSRMWIARLDAEIAEEALQEQQQANQDRSQEERANTRAAKQAQQEQISEDAQEKVAAQQRDLVRQRQLIDMDSQIRNLETKVEELTKMRSGQIAVDAYGRPTVLAANQRQIKAELAYAEKQLADLRAAKDDLERSH